MPRWKDGRPTQKHRLAVNLTEEDLNRFRTAIEREEPRNYPAAVARTLVLRWVAEIEAKHE